MNRPLSTLFIAAALLVAACSTPEAPQTVESAKAPRAVPIKVALNWYAEPEFGGLYAALAHGFYKDENLDVELIPGGPGSPVVPRVATGDVQFGVISADLVVSARAAGALIKCIFATFQTHPQGIMVHKKRGIHDLESLKGGTLALEVGPPFATWLRKKYAFEGVQFVPYDGSVSRFLVEDDYAQQVYVTSEPFLAQKQGAESQLFLVADTGYNPYANILVAADDLIKKDPDTVRRFIRATTKGWQRYLQTPEKANEEIQRLNPAMSPDVLSFSAEAQKPLIKGEGSPPAPLGQSSGERWTKLVDQLTKMGELTKKVSPDSLYTNEFLPVSVSPAP